MRAKGFGLALSLAVIAFAGASRADDISSDDRNTGKKEAPAIIAAAHVPCTMTDARVIGKSDDGSAYYEVACQEGLGYVLQSKGPSKPATVFDCVMMQPTPGQPESNIKCILPANKNPDAGLTPLVSQGGRQCAVAKARYLGSTADLNIYEVSCQAGPGYILQSPKAPGGQAVAAPCIQFDASPNMKCQFTTADQENAVVDQLAAASNKGCTVSKRRYVGPTADGKDIYEVACADGDGFMLMQAPTGGLAGAYDCGEAQNVAGGCKMTDAAALAARQLGKLTDQAKQAGFDCAVSKYAEFPPEPKSTVDIYELACSNRPEGGVAFFDTAGKSHVINCLRADAKGYRCSLTPDSALYPALTQQLHAKKPNTTCVVSGARAFGQTTAGADLVEVACEDKLPGYVIEYSTPADTASDLLTCGQAAQTGGGGCQLPTNKR